MAYRWVIVLVWQLLPWALLLRAPFFLHRCGLARRGGRALNLHHEAGSLLLLWYFLAVLGMTVNVARLLAGHFSLPWDYNLVPFAGIAGVVSTGNTVYILANLLGNLVLLAPLGFGLPLLWQGWARWYRTVPALALFSFSIEFVQFFTGRTADVDDLIFNTIGAALGYLCFVCVKLFAPRMVGRMRRRVLIHCPQEALEGISSSQRVPR